MNRTEHPVVIFDGVCNFCNASVNFILQRDKRQEIVFAANQSEEGKQLLAQYQQDPEQVETLYLLEADTLYDRSSAVLRIARHLRFPWNLLYAFRIVPRPIRDSIYKFIAKNRYRWFGKRDACRIPSPEERSRFLFD